MSDVKANLSTRLAVAQKCDGVAVQINLSYQESSVDLGFLLENCPCPALLLMFSSTFSLPSPFTGEEEGEHSLPLLHFRRHQYRGKEKSIP